MTTESEMQRKIVLAIWDAGMEGTRTDNGEIRVTTDDGSCGQKALVTEPVKKMIDEGNPPDLVFAVGPVVMMRAVAGVTREAGIKTVVSLNPIMVDGTGMCGACRVEVGGQTKFACVDGPDFDGHKVDYDLLIKRQRLYLGQEAEAFKRSAEIYA